MDGFVHHQLALNTGILFAVDSILFGSWVAHIPWLKERFSLDEAALGVLLFGLPAGLLSMNPFSGRIIGKIGIRNACLTGGIGVSLSLAAVVSMPNPYLVFIALYLAGACNALLNVAMNTSASEIERQDQIKIMSICHGMWSLGGMIGAGTTAITLWLHVDPRLHMAVLSILILLVVVRVSTVIKALPDVFRGSNQAFVLPNVWLLLLIFIGFTVNIGEGIAFDWSAVYLRETLSASPSTAALAFTLFSCAMMLTRFTGDLLIARYSSKTLLTFGGILAGVAMILLVLAREPVFALGAYLLLGIGVALGAPITYAMSMRIPSIPPATGLATFATFSFLGFLIGPPIIGLIARDIGLRNAFLLVSGLLLLGAFLSRKLFVKPVS
ncbi:MAG: MFS transporter [Saprospiraceae bacterium]|nr:MFS transporter [Saprospiraceae bacterium]